MYMGVTTKPENRPPSAHTIPPEKHAFPVLQLVELPPGCSSKYNTRRQRADGASLKQPKNPPTSSGILFLQRTSLSFRACSLPPLVPMAQYRPDICRGDVAAVLAAASSSGGPLFTTHCPPGLFLPVCLAGSPGWLKGPARRQ